MRRPNARRVSRRIVESYEALFHEVDVPNFFLNLRDDPTNCARICAQERLERAIGVIYRPETELISHYFHARLPDQFDAILHYDHTRAVEPLERTAEWEVGEVEETFPSGLVITVPALKTSLIALVLLAMPIFAQSPSPLPAEAKPVEGILVPVPNEIFRSLDQFRNVNWRAVQRPEVIHWKSHGDQVQIAALLGVVVAEGFIAMEAEDSVRSP